MIISVGDKLVQLFLYKSAKGSLSLPSNIWIEYWHSKIIGRTLILNEISKRYKPSRLPR